ncbi:hypothetical protein [Halalkalirubrum salinum]|uniref:hypothetical protein n=1 Tax=Halalkalirubrum salinum TaxID=2563889 RepID=UPI0010FBBA14|nr:hypothetical protein [Halalkalirubrum salinum]
MSLSDYTGETPPGFDTSAQIRRINHHRLWDQRGESIEPCANCAADLPLSERHIVVRLQVSADSDRETARYICDERCLHEWLDTDTE